MKKIVVFTAFLAALVAMPCRAETIFAATSGGKLLIFDSATPGTITKTLTVTGPGAALPLVAIDFRPATGELYSLSGTSRVSKLNTSVSGPAILLGNLGDFSLDGSSWGFDFNPTADRIRLVSNQRQNLRIHPDTGALAATDPILTYAAGDSGAAEVPHVVGAAYTNSFSTAGATALYDIDFLRDVLVVQEPANAGTLRTIGPLGVDTGEIVGFDISGTTGIAYASLSVGGTTGLYQINLLTGAATLIGAIADAATLGSDFIVDVAAGVPPSSKLLNIATRGRVGVGEDVLIGGFITSTGVSSRYVIRAIGPSLAGVGVTGPLGDPVLTLRDRNGAVITTNDDWVTSAQAAELTALGLAPSNDAESAILARLAPNNYTAVISGKGSNTGVAVVEVYALQ